MPEIIGPGQAPTVLEKAMALEVFIKKNWAEPWVVVPYLTVLNYEFVLGPRMNSATLEYRYGQVRREDGSAFSQVDHLWLIDSWVKISGSIPAGGANQPDAGQGAELDAWVGFIVSDQKKADGNEEFDPDAPGDTPQSSSGTQQLIAYGPEILLDRAFIQTARYFRDIPPEWVDAFPNITEIPFNVDRLPSFNLLHEDGHTVLGNWGVGNINDVEPEGFDSSGQAIPSIDAGEIIQEIGFGFRAPSDGGRVGNLRELVDYLIEHDGPKYNLNAGVVVPDGEDPAEPEYAPLFVLTGEPALLNAIKEVFDLDHVSVWEMLGRLLDRRRNIGFRVVTDGDPGLQISVEVFPLADESVTVGGVTIPGNQNVISVRADSARDVQDFEILHQADVTFDEIIVRGGLQKCMFSLAYADGTLAAGYSDALLAQFLQGIKGTDINRDGVIDATDDALYDGYSDAEKALLNDAYRLHDRFARAGTTFVIPQSWDFYVGDGEATDDQGNAPTDEGYDAANLLRFVVNPTSRQDGSIDWDTPAPMSLLDKRFLRSLLTKEGIDYLSWDGNGDFTDENEEGVLPSFLSPFVVVYDDVTGKWFYAHNIVEASQDERFSNATIGLRSSEPGIDVRFKLRQALLTEDWTQAEPTNFDPTLLPLLRWRKMIATVAMEMDNRLQVKVTVRPDVNPGDDLKRRLIVDVPNAERWILIGGTVLGVSPDGGLLRSRTLSDPSPVGPQPLPAQFGQGGVVLRDDLEQLQTVASLLAAWHGKYRAAVRFTVRNLRTYIRPGTILKTASTGSQSEQEVNTVVSRVRHDVTTRPPTTTIETSYQQINAVRATGFDAPGIPTVRSAASLIRGSQHKIGMIRQRDTDHTARLAISSGGSGSPITGVKILKAIENAEDDEDLFDEHGEHLQCLRVLEDGTVDPEESDPIVVQPWYGYTVSQFKSATGAQIYNAGEEQPVLAVARVGGVVRLLWPMGFALRAAREPNDIFY